MLEIDIPGFGLVQAEHLVSDFTGIHVGSIGEGLDLLVHPGRLKATLRY